MHGQKVPRGLIGAIAVTALMIGLGAAHAAVGVAIPAVMIGAGLENLLLPE